MILENNQLDLSSQLLLNGNQNSVAVLEPLGLNSNNYKDCGCGSMPTILDSLKPIELIETGLFSQNISSTISLDPEPFFGELQGLNSGIVINEQINGSGSLVDELNLLDNTGDLSKGSDQLRNELSIARRSPEEDGDDGDDGDDDREGSRFRFGDDDDREDLDDDDREDLIAGNPIVEFGKQVLGILSDLITVGTGAGGFFNQNSELFNDLTSKAQNQIVEINNDLKLNKVFIRQVIDLYDSGEYTEAEYRKEIRDITLDIANNVEQLADVLQGQQRQLAINLKGDSLQNVRVLVPELRQISNGLRQGSIKPSELELNEEIDDELEITLENDD